jgi:hypothetical protein
MYLPSPPNPPGIGMGVPAKNGAVGFVLTTMDPDPEDLLF